MFFSSKKLVFLFLIISLCSGLQLNCAAEHPSELRNRKRTLKPKAYEYTSEVIDLEAARSEVGQVESDPFALQEIVVYPREAGYNVYRQISQDVAKTLIGDDSQDGICAFVNDIDQNGIKAFVKSKLSQQLHPSDDTKMRLILSILANYYDKNGLSPRSNVLDEVTCKDLNILSGSNSAPKTCLASKISEGRTITAAGRAEICRMLIQPTADMKKLIAQQDIVKELVANESFFKELDTRLKELVEPENILLSFWNPEDVFTLILEEQKWKIPFDDKVKIIQNVSNWLNKSPYALESTTRIQSAFGWAINALALYGTIALPTYATTGYNIIPFLPAQDFNVVSIYSMMGIMCWLIKKVVSERSSSGASGTVAVWNSAKSTYDTVRHFGEGTVINDCMHKKIKYIAKYMQNLREMVNFVNSNKKVASKMPAVQRFSKKLEELNLWGNDFKYLLDLLKKKTFTGDYAWWMFFSRVMVAYRMIIEQKEQFVDAMLAIGELDAQLTIAKLYKEFQNKPVKFCFPTYLTQDQSPRPAFRVYNSWNPFLDSAKAVPNSISIGCEGTPQGVIITGPNAGGKSTITKAFIFCFILGQCFGISPAQALEFRPASIIMSYLNITDDIAAGKSFFKAGLSRAKDLQDASQSLNPGDCGVLALDEVFNGTEPSVAMEAARKLIFGLGNNPAVMCITNTHFPPVTTLEETGLFLNYKVLAVDNPGEEISYPFKLERGISDQNIVAKLLKQEGLL